MAVAWCYGTGCGDNFLTGFHDLMPTRRDILLIKKHLREEVGIAYNSDKWEESGVIVHATLSTRSDGGKAWVKTLKKLGFRKVAEGIGKYHPHDREPIVHMCLFTATAPKKARVYWGTDKI